MMECPRYGSPMAARAAGVFADFANALPVLVTLPSRLPGRQGAPARNLAQVVQRSCQARWKQED